MPENKNREIEEKVNEKFNRIREEVAKELGVFPEKRLTSGYNFIKEEKE
ncbi:hypothetical protein [Bacillus sp. FJAT-18017]|nr:hypothetical protein [Bacillus sp. FJAT-18017]